MSRKPSETLRQAQGRLCDIPLSTTREEDSFGVGNSSADSGFTRKIVIHRAVGGRLVAEHANHSDYLASMQRGMFKHMPQNFPAREAPLNSARKL
jgi:hypothetical protein